ncbi:MAG: hypothetical protein M3Z05_19565 [Gemmatimonadota bacterium]|nr:hypothetical protein [Gemmatimonadota bacterium]
MNIRLRHITPAVERLTPAATPAELRWFRKKRQTAFARTTLLTGGMCALYFVGSLFRDAHYAGHAFPVIGLGLVAFTQAYLVVRVSMSSNLVNAILMKRSAMDEEARKQIFLAALDDDMPVE